MNDQLMLEYIFFHEQPYHQFKQFLQSRNVKVLKEGVDQTDVEGLVVFIEDSLDEDLSDDIEAFYDEMMELNEVLVAAEQDNVKMSQVGLAVSLLDGRSVLASVDPDVLNRVLSVISHQELGQLVDNIVEAVENPDERPLCARHEASKPV